MQLKTVIFKKRCFLLDILQKVFDHPNQKHLQYKLVNLVFHALYYTVIYLTVQYYTAPSTEYYNPVYYLQVPEGSTDFCKSLLTVWNFELPYILRCFVSFFHTIDGQAYITLNLFSGSL